MRKTYVLDTNILLSYPTAIMGFDDNDVIITTTTLDELDNKKNAGGEVGFNARETIRMLDILRLESKDGLKKVKLPNGGELNVIRDRSQGEVKNKADDRIIETCAELLRGGRNNLILVTNDISMRIRASMVLGSDRVQSYKNTVVRTGYTGHRDLEVNVSLINDIYANKKAKVNKDEVVLISNLQFINENLDDFHENEFVTLHSGTSSVLTVFRNNELILIPEDIKLYDGIKPKNAMQHYAAWALTQPADELPLVILSGPAGSAKTFLSLAAGLEKTISDGSRRKGTQNEYFKMLISRPNSEAGDNGFGYLPGSLDEKMEPLLLPYYDNLESIIASDGDIEREQVKMQVDDLFETGIIEACALSYIRGRTLSNSYIICDEAQNAQRQLLKDVITRAGEGSKVIIAGDPTQCDNPQLDAYNNGLTYAVDCWKDSKYAAIITFEDRHSVRSALAKEALNRMK